MNYKVLQYTYSVLFDLHHNGRYLNTIRENTFTHTIWINYLIMIREYFVNSEIIIRGKKQKIEQVNSFGGKLVLSFIDSNTNERYSIDLVDI